MLIGGEIFHIIQQKGIVKNQDFYYPELYPKYSMFNIQIGENLNHYTKVDYFNKQGLYIFNIKVDYSNKQDISICQTNKIVFIQPDKNKNKIFVKA